MDLNAVLELPPRLMADQVFNGVVSTMAGRLNEDEYLTLQVITNKGVLKATW